MASRAMPDHHQSGVLDAANSEPTYRRASCRGLRDDCYPALLPGVDKPPSNSSNTRNSFVGDDVEKLYDFTTTSAATTDAGGRHRVACPDYAPAVQRAASTVEVGRTLAMFGADRLYQSTAAGTLACPLCVRGGGSAAWTREALYVERRPVTRHDRDHDVDCPLHVAKSSVDVTRCHQQLADVATYPPGMRSPDQPITADRSQPLEDSV